MMRSHGSILRALLPAALLGAAFLLEGCSPAKPREGERTAAGENQKATAPAEVGVRPATGPASPPASTPSSPAKPDAAGVPPALKELKDKLEPPGIPPTVKPDEKKLLADVETFAAELIATLRKGDAEAAHQLAFTSKDFAEAVSPGFREILEGNLMAQNQAVIDRLAASLKGKEVAHKVRPGTLTPGGRSTFTKDAPILSNTFLEADVNGVPIEIHLDQLVYLDGRWKIFRITTP